MGKKENPVFRSLYESSTLRTAGIVMSVVGAYMTVHTLLNSYLDQQNPVFTTENGRQVVRGPGYEIAQAKIDPTIVSVIKQDPFWIINGFQRGEATLYRLCESPKLIHRDEGRTMHVKVENAKCLKLVD
jgi:hypothetical protein